MEHPNDWRNAGQQADEERATVSRLILAVAAVCTFTLGPAATASAKKPPFPKPFAITESGPVLGVTADGIDEYLGIPYAQPPTGALRWMPPVAFGKFSAPLQANQFGSECTQPGPSGSEDCLFLNVYTPASAGPGGSVIEGAGDEDLPAQFRVARRARACP